MTVIVQPAGARDKISISNPISMNDIAVSSSIRRKFPTKKKVSRRPQAVPRSFKESDGSLSDVSSLASSSASSRGPALDTNTDSDEAPTMVGLDMLSNPVKALAKPKENYNSDSSSETGSKSSRSSRGSRRSPMAGDRRTPPVRSFTAGTGPSAPTQPQPGLSQPFVSQLSYEEIQSQKQEFLFKLHRLSQRGIRSERHLTMKNSLEDIKVEYENLTRDVDVEASIKFQRRVVMAAVSGMEFMNSRFDPFDLKLDGWSESVMDSVEDFDPTFERLHEKYKTRAQMAPEMELMMSLAGSAFMFHLSNSIFKSQMPNMDDILKQNPELAQNIGAAMQNNGAQPPGPSGPPKAEMMNSFINNIRDPEEERKMNAPTRPANFGDSVGGFQRPAPSLDNRWESASDTSSDASDTEVKNLSIKNGKKTVSIKL